MFVQIAQLEESLILALVGLFFPHIALHPLVQGFWPGQLPGFRLRRQSLSSVDVPVTSTSGIPWLCHLDDAEAHLSS